MKTGTPFYDERGGRDTETGRYDRVRWVTAGTTGTRNAASPGHLRAWLIATINLALAIITEATLSFLGVGVPSTQPSLGTLIRIGNDFLFSGEWWITIFPGITLAVLALAVNLLGDWLRDALNPKLR